MCVISYKLRGFLSKALFSSIIRFLSTFSTMPDHTPFIALDTTTDWQSALQHSEQEPIVIYKHSAACGISARARRLMQNLIEEGDPPVYEVVVQQARSVSNEIESHLGVRHETPQVIILHNREPVYDTSHSRIRPESIRDHLAAENRPSARS